MDKIDKSDNFQGPFHGVHREVPSHGANTCKDGSDKDQNNPAVPALISGSVVDAESGKHISGAKVRSGVNLAV